MDNLTLSLLMTERLPEADLAAFSDADWELIVREAQTQGVAPLIYWRLSKAGKFSSQPEAARNALRAHYSTTFWQNQQLFKELEHLSREFHQAGIPVVVLKGACFALTIYPDPGLRPMGDLDLLVPAPRLKEAVALARGLGYLDATPEATPGLNALLSHEVCLQKPGTPSTVLEIHESLVADKTFLYAVPVGWFWEQTEALDIPAQARFENLLILTPTAQLLYAAGHAMLQHGGQNAPLRWFYDLDQLIRFYPERLNWDLLLAQARIFEWGSALNAALALTQEYFETPIPARVREDLSGVGDRHQKLVALKQEKPATHTLGERQKFLSLNWAGRLRLVLALITPGPAYMRWRYRFSSAWWLPVYYLRRWGGILADGARTLFSLFRVRK